MSRQSLLRSGAGFGPRIKAPLRKPLLAEPKTLGVIDEALQCAAAPSTEHEERAIERIGLEGLPAESGEAIDALTKIDGLDRQQDPHLRGDLDHGAVLQNEWAKATQAAGSWPV